MELPATTRRVSAHSPEAFTEKIWNEAERRIWYYAWHPDEIPDRLAELDREWDIERALETNASAIALFGMGLTAVGGRRYLPLPMTVMAFLLQHALQGWCPPVSLFRRLGLRTQAEIEAERYALKALRGDFRDLAATGEGVAGQPADKAMKAVRE